MDFIKITKHKFSDKTLSIILIVIVSLVALLVSIKTDIVHNISKIKIDVNNAPALGNAVNYITGLAGSASSSEIDVIPNTHLAYDENQNLRYVGSNPDNYIWFNNELWRIIGVINVDGERHLKLVRDDIIGEYSWNSSPNGYGSNDWSEAVLMKLLNPGYEDNTRDNSGGKELANNSLYWNRQSGICLTRSGEGWDNCDFTSKGLDKDYKRLISKVSWNIGSVPNHNTEGYSFGLDFTPKQFDEYEKAVTWNGYVGLLNYTDYAYAISNENANRNECLTKSQIRMDDDKCFGNLYLFHKTSGWDNWFLTLNTEDLEEERLAFESCPSNGCRIHEVYSDSYPVKPVVYLNSDVNLKSGNGTHDNPYLIGMNYNVEFNDEERITNVVVDENTSVNPIDNQGKEGYTFKHWSLSKTGEAFDFSTLINQSITLYAVYEPIDLTVEFYDKNRTHIKTINTKYDSKLNISEIPIIDEDDFVGFREDNSIENFDYDTVIKRNYKLYAKHVNCDNDSQAVSTLKEKINTDGIYKDPFNNIRYRGKNAKNYIRFNNELWRIIGTFKVKDKYGVNTEKIKIVKHTPIGNPIYVYDTSVSENQASGVNEWSQADIMKLLNPGYEDNKEEVFSGQTSKGVQLVNNSLYWNKQSGKCFTSSHNQYVDCDFTNIGLNDDAKNYIETVMWNTGAINYENIYTMTARDLYEQERGSKTGKDNKPEGVDDSVERSTIWLGKIGLLYGSDIEYASDSTDQYNIDYCMEKVSQNNPCKSLNSWLSLQTAPSHFLISPVYGSQLHYVFMDGYGSVTYGSTYYSGFYVKPTLYLKSNIKITSGDGSEGNPYEIELYDAPVCVKKVNVEFNDEERITNVTIDEGAKVEEIDSKGKEGHTFKYWSLSKTGGAFDFNQNITEDVTLYAVYEIKKFDVEFIDEEEEVEKLVIDYNNVIDDNKIPIVSKKGYEFIGWREKDEKDNFDFTKHILRNYRLYANYKKIEEDRKQCNIFISSRKYSIDNDKLQINNVPKNDTYKDIESNLTIESSDYKIMDEKVIVTCDDVVKEYKINRVWIPQTGQNIINYFSLIGYIAIITVLLIVINKQRQINLSLRR